MLTKIQKGNSIYMSENIDGMTDDLLDKVSIAMINNNQDKQIGLAPITFESMNGIYNKIMFEITGMVTLREHITKKISQDKFKKMLLNIIRTMEQFDEYMIDTNQVILNVDNVFINEIDNNISFLCIPVKNMENHNNLYDFFKNIVETSYVEWNANEICYFNGVYNVIKNESGFSLQNMKKVLITPVNEQNSDMHDIHNGLKTEASGLPKKIEEPETITIPHVIKQQAVKPVTFPEEKHEEKKSFLERIFSKKKKPSSTPTSGYQSGLAGLKNHAVKTSDNRPSEMMPALDISTLPDESKTDAVTKPPINFEGTTVLNSTSGNQAEQRKSQHFGNKNDFLGTTTLNPVGQNVQGQGTTILNPVKPKSVSFETTTLNPTTSNQTSPETTVLNQQSPETTILSVKPAIRAFLIRKKNNETVEINKPLFTIGRDSNDRDYCINDNIAVGHRHAQIIRKGNLFFIMDMNSKNHTYVNNILVPPGVEKQIDNGDNISIADERLEFKLF